MDSNNLDTTLVVDLEATCWRDPNEKGTQESDIIEIGIAEVNVKTLSITRFEGIIVKPTKSKIGKFCTELTTLTPAYVEKNGVSFVDACKKIETFWDSSKKSWWSFGDYDRKMMFRQSARENIKCPFSETHYNIKNLASMALSLNKEVGLKKMLDLFKMPLEGTHHRGVDDAKNISKILIEILKRIKTGVKNG